MLILWGGVGIQLLYIDFCIFNLQVETTTFRDSILDVTTQRNDALGKAVIKRITPVNDLIAADAEYHRECHRIFISIKAGRETAGHPENEQVNASMEGICPTIGAAAQHSYRVYCQVQMWLSPDEDINYTDRGWEKDHQTNLLLILTEEPLIPEVQLKMLFCGCKKGCTSANCSCRRNGNNIDQIIYSNIVL